MQAIDHIISSDSGAPGFTTYPWGEVAPPIHRRAFLNTGLAAVGAMLAGSSKFSWAGGDSALDSQPLWTPVPLSGPILQIPLTNPVIQVGGLPFAPAWFGDDFPSGGFPFHVPESPRRWASLEEHVDVAIIGGGLSGLSTANELGDRPWVLFDLRSRFGGVAQGERWNRLPYSQGSAYFIVPDDDSADDRLYRKLGVYDLAEVDEGGGFRFEYAGRILDDVCQDCTPSEMAALKGYQAAVDHYANREYPDIPWSEPGSLKLVRSLDTQSFHDAVRTACQGEPPPLLAKAIQAYCYSSFGVGWDELSAAAGWNFIAAEEFGRIVLPGGNAGLASLLWQQLKSRGTLPSGRPRLRAGCMVTNVRMDSQGVQLAWRDVRGNTHTLGAKRVVYAGAKQIFPHMMPTLGAEDPDKLAALDQVNTTAYVVANILLTKKVRPEFYDLFAIHDDKFPMDDNAFELDSRITDAVNGSFAVVSPHPTSDVLTLYWPLPWHTARFTLVTGDSLMSYVTRAAPQIVRLLHAVDLLPEDVAEIRMTRWGHAMPYAPPGTYSSDLCDVLRRPVGGDRVWFANQDTVLLPAVETCLAESRWVAKHIA